MPIKLLAISGPLRKSEFPLGAELTLGCGSDNHVRLRDPAVSPHHCAIAAQDGRTILSDLDSESGTFVNGIPIKRRELKSGDEIAVGSSVFLFEDEKSESAPSSPVQMSEDDAVSLKTLELPPDELRNLRPESLAALPEGRLRDERETELQLARGLSLFTTKGFISAEAAEAYARARALAE